MKTIEEKENELFTLWESEFEKNGDSGFCRDGLIFNGALYNEDQNRHSGNQEEIWSKAKRKIVFFMKEANDNEGEDYREWWLYARTGKMFFRMIYSWLNGLTIVGPDSRIPSMIAELDKSIPLCIVNAKKKSGGSFANYNEIYDHVNRYKDFLRQQLDIYSPNIIVCGGSRKMADIAKALYGDVIDFVKMEGSNWIWYSVEKKLILIDSYHPSAPGITNEEKYDTLIEHFQKFLRLNKFDL
ncbi:MAG: hypothetical protein BWY27_01438 [Bacteroidetes bacterium ADurb.Bin234]|jgi:hypothetical protein|nr:MAG: hypothetical protein BWY27_01438 [Bacteroidetes bacterium ADurb.Bin234]